MRALMATSMVMVLFVATGCDSGTTTRRAVDSGVDADQNGLDGNAPDIEPDRSFDDAPVGSGVADADNTPAVDRPAAHEAGDSSFPDLGVDSVSQDGSTTWCASSTHMFCADFDRTSYETDWSASVKIGEGQLGPTLTTASSSPSALLSSLPLPAIAPAQARIEKRFLPRPREARLEFDVLVQDPRSDADVRAGARADIFSIFQDANQVLTGIKVVRGGSSTDTTYVCVQRTVTADRQDCGSFFDQSVHDPIPVGRWAHVALLYKFPGIPERMSAGSIDLKIDGVSVVSYNNVIDADAVAATSTATVFSLGLVGGAPSGGSSTPGARISAAYDNVTLDLVW